tara:strand:- start:69 stop:356 length:288 start_codon:yes stop_codon:yes gene_type:complete
MKIHCSIQQVQQTVISDCQKCKTPAKGFFVDIFHHGTASLHGISSLLDLTWEEKVKKFFNKSHKSIDHNNMKDLLWQKIQEKGLKVTPAKRSTFG